MGARCGSHVVIVTVISRVQGAPSVSREGIEPSTRGLKVPCSATELPAHILYLPRFQYIQDPTHYPPVYTRGEEVNSQQAESEESVYRRKDGRYMGEYTDATGKRRYVSGKVQNELALKSRQGGAKRQLPKYSQDVYREVRAELDEEYAAKQDHGGMSQGRARKLPEAPSRARTEE